MTRLPSPSSFETHDVAELDHHFRSVFESGPRLVGPYQLGRVIGHGRLGPTHDAWYVEHQRAAVVKLLEFDPGIADRHAAERAMLGRLKKVAQVVHPVVVALQQVGQAEKGLYVASPAVGGRTLEEALASGWRPAPPDAVDLVRALAAGLAEAHASGVTHGNLHAGQVMITGNLTVPRITDLGLWPASRDLVRTHGVSPRLGDRVCQPPEQRSSGRCGPAGDVHALGVLLIRLLVDESQFVAAAHACLHPAVEGGAWPPVDTLRPDLPPRLCDWIAAATARELACRPTLADGLPEGLVFAPVASPAEGPRAPRPRVARRWFLAGTLASSVAMAGLLHVRPAPSPVHRIDAADLDATMARDPPAAGPTPRDIPAPTTPRLRLDR